MSDLPPGDSPVPVTGDGPVDVAMDQLRRLPPGGGPEAAEVLLAVHEQLQRRLSATTG